MDNIDFPSKLDISFDIIWNEAVGMPVRVKDRNNLNCIGNSGSLIYCASLSSCFGYDRSSDRIINVE